MAALQDDETLREQPLSPFRKRLQHLLFPWPTLPPRQRTIRSGGPIELPMIAACVCNMVVLALTDAQDTEDASTRSTVLRSFDLFFSIVYAIEIALRMLCFGTFIYRHPLRFFDLLLVVSNFVLLLLHSLGVPSTNFSLLGIRCGLRVIRPLFIITNFPAVRLFVVSVSQSLLQLTDVFLLYILFLLWFGVAGVYQFGGLLQARCVNDLSSAQEMDFSTAAFVMLDPATGDPRINMTAYSLTLARLDDTDDAYRRAIFFPMIPLAVNATALFVALQQANRSAAADAEQLVYSAFPQDAWHWSGIPQEHRRLGGSAFSNVTQIMADVAISSFMRSYSRFRGLSPADFRCGSSFIQDGSFAADVSHVLTGTAPAPRFCAQRCCEEEAIDPAATLAPALTDGDQANRTASPSLSLSGSATATEQTEQRGAHCRPVREDDVIWDPPNVSGVQLQQLLSVQFSLDPRVSCATDQMCDLTWSSNALRGYRCPYAYTCTPDIANPFGGRMGFDNLGMALVALYVSVTFQLWYDLMAMARDASDEFSYIFFMMLMILGMFTIINLTIVVLTVGFEKAKAAEKLRMRHEADQISNVKAAHAKQLPAFVSLVREAMAQKTLVKTVAPPAMRRSAGAAGIARPRSNAVVLSIKAPASEMNDDVEMLPCHGEEECVAAPPEGSPEASTQQPQDHAEAGDRSDGESIDSEVSMTSSAADRGAERLALEAALAVEETEFWRRYLRVKLAVKKHVLEAWWFEWLALLVVVANTVILCYDHFGMSSDVDRVFDWLNIAFACFFTIELICRFIGTTPKRFVANRFNLFDLVVVIVSFADLFVDESSFPLLHAFRIVRLMKVLKMLPRLYRWITFMVAAAEASPLLVLMIALEIFIFACFAMQFFGGRFCGLRDAPPTRIEYTEWMSPDLTTLYDYPLPLTDCGTVGSHHEDPLVRNASVAACLAAVAADPAAVPLPPPSSLRFFSPHVIPLNATPRQLGVVVAERIVPLEHLHAGRCEGLPRTNFDSFGSAFLTAFIVLTGDDWEQIMFDAISVRGWGVTVLFMLFFYVGNIVMLNLFIAIFLSANVKEESEENIEEALREERRAREAAAALEAMEREEEAREKAYRFLLYGDGDGTKLRDDDDEDGEHEEEEEDGQQDTKGDDDDYHHDDDAKRLRDKPSRAPHERGSFDGPPNRGMKRRQAGKEKTMPAKAIEALFRVWDASAVTTKKMLEHLSWQIFISCVILFGSVCMGLENPISAPDTQARRTLRVIDIVVTAIYIAEVLLNCHAYGVIRKRTSYLRRDSWNVLDFALVVISIIGVSVANLRENIVVRILKVLRALRPLRLVKRSPGMRVVLAAVVASLTNLVNVVMVALAIFTIWAVAGVSLFRGRLQTCFLGDVHLPSLNISECTLVGGSFKNEEQHFDNIGAALLTVFQIATLEGWAHEMFRAMDSTPYGEPPQRNASPFASLFFVSMAAFGGFFLSNLFVSVLINAYNTEKRKAALQRSILVTREQEAWLLTNRRIARFLPIKRDQASAGNDAGDAVHEGGFHCARVLVRRLVHSGAFTKLVDFLIFANFITMAIEHYPQSLTIHRAVDQLNVIFTAVFVLEALLKIFGESFRVYFSSKWNTLDFFVMLVSLLSVATSSVYNARASALFRALRVVRLARLTRGVFTIDKMIAKFGYALLSLTHVFAVIFLILFIFSITGMKLFGRVRLAAFSTSRGLDTHFNFALLSSAMLTLARAMTGGDWPHLMGSSGVREPFCDPAIGECGPPTPLAELFFVLFCLVGTFVLRNLLTAVLLESFESSGQQRAISKRHAQFFYRTWKQFDPQESLLISPFDTLSLVRALPQTCILGFNGKPKRKKISLEFQFLVNLKLRSLQQPLPISHVIDTLTRMAFIVPAPENASFADEQRAIKATLVTSLKSLGTPLTTHVKALTNALTLEKLQRAGSSLARGLQDMGNTLEDALLRSAEERERQQQRAVRRAERADQREKLYDFFAASPQLANDDPENNAAEAAQEAPTDDGPNHHAHALVSMEKRECTMQPSTINVAKMEDQQLVFLGEVDTSSTPQEIHARCAALIMLNAVVRRRRDQLRRKAMNARARRLLQEFGSGEDTRADEGVPLAGRAGQRRRRDTVMLTRIEAGECVSSSSSRSSSSSSQSRHQPTQPLRQDSADAKLYQLGSAASAVTEHHDGGLVHASWMISASLLRSDSPPPPVSPIAPAIDIGNDSPSLIRADAFSTPLPSFSVTVATSSVAPNQKEMCNADESHAAPPPYDGEPQYTIGASISHDAIATAMEEASQAIAIDLLAASDVISTHLLPPNGIPDSRQLHLLLSCVPKGHMNIISNTLDNLSKMLHEVVACARRCSKAAPRTAFNSVERRGDPIQHAVLRLLVFTHNFSIQAHAAVHESLDPATRNAGLCLPDQMSAITNTDDGEFLGDVQDAADCASSAVALLPSSASLLSPSTLNAVAAALQEEVLATSAQRVVACGDAAATPEEHAHSKEPFYCRIFDAVGVPHDSMHFDLAVRLTSASASILAHIEMMSSGRIQSLSDIRVVIAAPPARQLRSLCMSSASQLPRQRTWHASTAAIFQTNSTLGRLFATCKLLSFTEAVAALWPKLAPTFPLFPLTRLEAEFETGPFLGSSASQPLLAKHFRRLALCICFQVGDKLNCSRAPVVERSAAEVVARDLHMFASRYWSSGPLFAAAGDALEKAAIATCRAGMPELRDDVGLATVLRKLAHVAWDHRDLALRKAQLCISDLMRALAPSAQIILDEDDPRVADMFALCSDAARRYPDGDPGEVEGLIVAADEAEASVVDACAASDVARRRQRNVLMETLSLSQLIIALRRDLAELQVQLQTELVAALALPAIEASFGRVASLCNIAIKTRVAVANFQLLDPNFGKSCSELDLQRVRWTATLLWNLQLRKDSVVPLQLVDLVRQMEMKVAAVCKQRAIPVPLNTPLRLLCRACSAANLASRRLLDVLRHRSLQPQRNSEAAVELLEHAISAAFDAAVGHQRAMGDLIALTYTTQICRATDTQQPSLRLPAGASDAAIEQEYRDDDVAASPLANSAFNRDSSVVSAVSRGWSNVLSPLRRITSSLIPKGTASVSVPRRTTADPIATNVGVCSPPPMRPPCRRFDDI